VRCDNLQHYLFILTERSIARMLQSLFVFIHHMNNVQMEFNVCKSISLPHSSKKSVGYDWTIANSLSVTHRDVKICNIVKSNMYNYFMYTFKSLIQ